LWVFNGVQVYYIYRIPFYAQSTLPTFFGAQRLLRVILIRERINLVHAHQAFSTLGCETILHARTMGYKVIPPGVAKQQPHKMQLSEKVEEKEECLHGEHQHPCRTIYNIQAKTSSSSAGSSSSSSNVGSSSSGSSRAAVSYIVQVRISIS
jgi:hypothetical protein